MDVHANNWAGRIEDDALLRGRGRFGDDAPPPRAVHVGEPVALVVAETRAAAQDAAEAVAIDYAPLSAVVDAAAAIAPGAPLLWPQAGGNIAFDWSAPADADGSKQVEIDRIFAHA